MGVPEFWTAKERQMGQHLTKRDVEKIEKEIEMRRVELLP